MKRCLFYLSLFSFLFVIFTIASSRANAQAEIPTYPDAGGSSAWPIPCDSDMGAPPCPTEQPTFPDSGGGTVWVPPPPTEPETPPTEPETPEAPPPPIHFDPPPQATIPTPPLVSLEGSGGCSMVANAAGVGHTIPTMIFGIFAAVTCFRPRRSK